MTLIGLGAYPEAGLTFTKHDKNNQNPQLPFLFLIFYDILFVQPS